MAGEFALPGIALGAGIYGTSKFFYSAIETYGRHSEIADKNELSEDDIRFLEESVKDVDEYLNWNRLERVNKLLGKPEEWGKNWGHIMAANELDVYEGEFQYGIPGYENEEIADLLEPQEA